MDNNLHKQHLVVTIVAGVVGMIAIGSFIYGMVDVLKEYASIQTPVFEVSIGNTD